MKGKSKIRFFISKIICSIQPYDKYQIIEKYVKNRNMKIQVLNTHKDSNTSFVKIDWDKNITKPLIGLVKSEFGINTYWEKFELFLVSNSMPYKFIDIRKSNFIEEIKEVDIVVWRTPSSYIGQWEADDKIEFIQDYMHKKILPDRKSLWFYENKIREQYLFELYNLPRIKTFITYSKDEALDYINNAKYPLISKNKTSAASENVSLVKNKKQARKIWRKVFYNGLYIGNSYVKQKDYILFQEYVPNYGYDLRVIIIGNYYFGYYRYPAKRDFRASGSGIVEKKEIPIEVLKIAKQSKNHLPKSSLLAVDFLRDSRDDQYYIIETSIFVSVETPEQLVVNGIPGRYVEVNDDFVFEEGRFWPQELMLENLLKDWLEEKKIVD